MNKSQNNNTASKSLPNKVKVSFYNKMVKRKWNKAKSKTKNINICRNPTNKYVQICKTVL